MNCLATTAMLAALIPLAACSLPQRDNIRLSQVYEEPSTGSLISGGDESERIGKNPNASFQQPSSGIGSPGFAPPGGLR